MKIIWLQLNIRPKSDIVTIDHWQYDYTEPSCSHLFNVAIILGWNLIWFFIWICCPWQRKSWKSLEKTFQSLHNFCTENFTIFLSSYHFHESAYKISTHSCLKKYIAFLTSEPKLNKESRHNEICPNMNVIAYSALIFFSECIQHH